MRPGKASKLTITVHTQNPCTLFSLRGFINTLLMDMVKLKLYRLTKV